MLQDKASHVAGVFREHPLYMSYSTLASKSVRNSLLALYLIDNLPGDEVRHFLAKDRDRKCVPKLAIADEAYAVTRRPVVLPRAKIAPEDEDKEATFWRRVYDDRREEKGVRLGRCYGTSSVDKVVMVCGTRMFEKMCEYGNGHGNPAQKTAGSRSVVEQDLLMQPGFRGLAKGASPMHAAYCYLTLLEEEPVEYEDRVAWATESSELRQLLAFREYHKRTVLQHLRAENIEALRNPENPMELVFLQAVLNWNRDLLLRLVKA